MACEIIDVLRELLPNDVYFVVGVANPLVNSGTPVQNGDNSFTIPSFKGWKTRLIRGSFPQYLTNPGTGNQYWDYTAITGEFTLSNPAGTNEEFIAMAYKPA